MKQIKVKDETHQKLMEIKNIMDYNSIDETIDNLILGAVDEYNVISREPVALTLTYLGFNVINYENGDAEPSDSNSYDITFKELNESKVGDKFVVDAMNYTYYIEESAKVIYKETNFVVLKIESYDSLEDSLTYNLVGITLM